jgi:hypothetical protein
MGTPVSAPKLSLALRRLAEAMAHGIDTPYFPGTHREIAPGAPLPLRLAALAVGCRVRRAEAAAMTKPFLDALAAEVALRRETDDPSKLALAIETRDNGDAPDARLEAIDTVRGKQPVRPTPRKPNVPGFDGVVSHFAAPSAPPATTQIADEPEERDAETPPGFFPAPWLEKEGRVPPPEPPTPAPPVPGTLNAHPMYREPAFKGPSQPGAYQGPRAIRVAPRLGQHR